MERVVKRRWTPSAGGVLLLGVLATAIIGVRVAQQTANDSQKSPSTQTQPSEPDHSAHAGGLIGSKHDFSDGGRLPGNLCLPCHSPHITAAEAPLLIQRSAASQPIRAFGSKAGVLDAASLVCLSCHDGVVAHDVFAGAHGASWSDLSTSGIPVGGTRLTSHPVGVEYPANDPKYRSATEVTTVAKLKLPDGRMQCTTCHDPHNTERHPSMLQMSNERSRLCLSCHRI